MPTAPTLEQEHRLGPGQPRVKVIARGNGDGTFSAIVHAPGHAAEPAQYGAIDDAFAAAAQVFTVLYPDHRCELAGCPPSMSGLRLLR